MPIRRLVVSLWIASFISVFGLPDARTATSNADARTATSNASAPTAISNAAVAAVHAGDCRDAGDDDTTCGAVPAVARRSSTSSAVAALASTPTWNITRYGIRTLTGQARLYSVTTPASKAWPEPGYHDSAGVPMRLIKGKLYYHPVGLANTGLKYISSYWLTRDPAYLTLAKRIAHGLIKIGVSARGGIWFPYRFPFAMHGVASDTLQPPWYSGMAQGLALSLFTRLWNETHYTSYKALADSTYNSLRAMGRGSNPWVSWVDAGRYVWLEEYPADVDHTLNGFNFAIFGLYDYYQATRDLTHWTAARRDDALALLRGGITTIRHYVSRYRNPGSVSNYCLKHGRPQLDYHLVHIAQLRILTRLTGDAYFANMANLFKSDTS